VADADSRIYRHNYGALSLRTGARSLGKVRLWSLRAASPAIRFLSCEPLLGPLDDLPLAGIHWVIVGGESGPHARPMNADWVESIFEQCREANVSIFLQAVGRGP
jgi:protein gp37